MASGLPGDVIESEEHQTRPMKRKTSSVNQSSGCYGTAGVGACIVARPSNTSPSGGRSPKQLLWRCVGPVL